MTDINKVIIVGRLTNDPETRNTRSTSLAQFSLAVNSSWKNASGERQDEVSFFRVLAWGKLGQIVKEYCEKGKI